MRLIRRQCASRQSILLAGLAALLAGILAACALPQPAMAGNVSWRSIGPAEFGAMFGVAISPHDPKVIVAGLDMGNAFLTRDGGKSWKIIGRNGGESFANPAYQGTWGVCFDPRCPQRIFIGSTHGIFRSTDGGENWRLLQGGGADYTTHAIAVDPANPDIIYAAAGVGGRGGVSWSCGRVWRSTDGGDTWGALGAGGPLEKAAVKGANWVTIAIDPQSPLTARNCHSRIYLCGQSGFFVSENGGQTWTNLESNLPGGIVQVREPGVQVRSICDLALVPGSGHATLFATIALRYTDAEKRQWLGGVYRSDDGGRNWVEKNKGLEASLAGCVRGQFKYCLLAACPAQPKVIYLNNAAGVYKSEDGGESWHSVVKLGTIWLQGKDADGKRVDWRVRDRSGNFDQSYYNVYGPANGLAVCPTNPDVVAYTDNAGMGLSYDGGTHWTEPGFEFGDAVWPGEFGGRPPMQLTHKVRSRGFQLIVPRDAAIDPFDPQTIAIGHDDTGLEISRDGGTWWEWAYHGLLGGERNNIRAVLFDPAVRNRLFVGGGGWGGHGHVYRSDDGGRHFTAIGIPQINAESEKAGKTPYVWALALDPASPLESRTLYAGTDLGLFRTSNGGQTWESLALVPGKVLSIHHIRMDPADTRRLYASTYSAPGLYRSDDAGKTWVPLAPEKLGGIKSLTICQANGTIYAIAAKAGQVMGYWTARSLWRSDDHGGTWRKLDDRLGSAVAVHPRKPDCIYYMTFAQDVRTQRTNVYRSRDGGQSWEAVGDDIPLSPGGDGNRIVFDPRQPSRFLITHNSGTYEGIEP